MITKPKWQQDVETFMKLAGQEIPEKPVMPGLKIETLRWDLIEEELKELERAENTTEAADAIADLLYVVIGTAVAYGINIGPIFDEVHRSNMSKFIDGHRREDGKWIKGPSYSPANLEPLIQEQMK